MTFSSLKQRIIARGKPKTPQAYRELLGVFTPAELEALGKSQRLLNEGIINDCFDDAVETAMRVVVDELDYSPEDAADFIRLGKEMISRMPGRPDMLAKMAAYFDAEGNPHISQTRH